MKFYKRLEIWKNIDFWFTDTDYIDIYNEELYKLYKFDLNYKLRYQFSIFILNLHGTYRGWRHLVGLPVRGQRTWTNSNSVYKANVYLREYRLLVAKVYYQGLVDKSLMVLILAESFNYLWYTQWSKQWREMFTRREKFVKNVKKGKIARYDFVLLAKGVVFGFKKALLTKKQKADQKHNIFTAGFLPGFTRDCIWKNKLGELSKLNIQLVFHNISKKKLI